MSSLNEINQEGKVENKNYAKGPIGNKLDHLVDVNPIGGINTIIAKSFIDNANNGMLPFLNENNINYNNDGIYEVSCDLLREICEMMEDNNAVNLNFTLVEIPSNDSRLDVNPMTSGKMIYMVASLQTIDEKNIPELNYLIMNAKSDQSLEELKITDTEFLMYKEVFDNSSSSKLKEYFPGPYSSKKNTCSVFYNIEDIKDTLAKVNTLKFNVYMCEISDVLAIIEENNLGDQLNVALYEEHFESRVKQLTMVFESGADYYDMGSLRP
ncbi:hypothetical protein OF897_14770 [Chryseobacterium formosus]|uniref:Uncharacterized protein n=1 Tax=Chryseobacterium formosus TaxID=1537363 RepID=A0ABT3XTH7_9FLAO|nr:hypothetical protein [Chryseobacterium formosus]MCX8525181.1 hypothetical protein [Chryseobacterium formosus]